MEESKLTSNIEKRLKEYIDDFKERYFNEYSDEKRENAKSLMDFATVPDNVKYSKVEKYIKENNVEITHRMFTSYIQQGILPPSNKINEKMALYSKNHILLYLLVADIKKYINLDRIGNYIDILKPEMEILGIEDVVKSYYENEKEIHSEIFRMIEQLFIPVGESIIESLEDEFKGKELTEDEKNMINKVEKYLSMVTISNIILLMGKSMLDSFDKIVSSYEKDEKSRVEIDEIIKFLNLNESKESDIDE